MAQSLEKDMRLKAPIDHSMHAMYNDGSDIPDALRGATTSFSVLELVGNASSITSLH